MTKSAIAVVIIFLLGCTHWYTFQMGNDIGSARTQSLWDKERTAWAVELEKQQQIQLNLQLAADQLRKRLQSETIAIHARLTAELDRLRHRPTARVAACVSEASPTGAGATGAGLARPDGEFLAGYAADAARLQQAYNECKVKYELIDRYADR